jgi:hypothetical protein
MQKERDYSRTGETAPARKAMRILTLRVGKREDLVILEVIKLSVCRTSKNVRYINSEECGHPTQCIGGYHLSAHAIPRVP